MAKNWFADGLKIIFPSTRLQGISFLTENNDELQETTRSLLAYFNTGISDVRLYKIKKEDVNLSSDLLDNILSKAKNGKAYSMAATVGGEMLLFEVNANGGYEIYKQKAVHRNLTSSIEVVFDLSEESNGSIRLLGFIPMLIDLKQNEVDYLIDGIDRSMHPMLSQKILESAISQDWSQEETPSSSSPPMNVTCSNSTLSELTKSCLSRRERMEHHILHPWQNSSLVKMFARVIF